MPSCLGLKRASAITKRSALASQVGLGKNAGFRRKMHMFTCHVYRDRVKGKVGELNS